MGLHEGSSLMGKLSTIGHSDLRVIKYPDDVCKRRFISRNSVLRKENVNICFRIGFDSPLPCTAVTKFRITQSHHLETFGPGRVHRSVSGTGIDHHVLHYGRMLRSQRVKQRNKMLPTVQRGYVYIYLCHCVSLVACSRTVFLLILIFGGLKSWIQVPPDVTK